MKHALLARDGTGGWARHRIPALALTPEGDLLAVHDGRHGIDDLPAPIDLLAQRSTDGGRSWGSVEILRTGAGIDGFGDASLLVDSQGGRLLLWCAASTYAGFFESGAAADNADPHVLHTDLGVSADDGHTWTWERKTAELRGQLDHRDDRLEPVSGLFPSSGGGIHLTRGRHRGRLLQSFLLLRGTSFYLVVARSEDGGASWRLSNELGPGANESTMCELADGEVLLHSRSVGARLAAHSVDGGATFSRLQPVPDLLDPGCNGSLVSWVDDAGVHVVASHLDDPDLRRRLVLDLSPDGGRSWTQRAVITDAEAAYSTAVVTDSGLAVLWEAEGTRSLMCSLLDETDFLPAGACSESFSGFEATLRHVEPAAVEPSPYDVEVPAVDAASWGPGVYKMAAPTSGGVQRIRSRAGPSTRDGDALSPGDTLVLDARLGDWSPGDRLLVDGQPADCELPTTSERTVAFGIRRPITLADLTGDPLVIAFEARRENSSALRALGTLTVPLRAGPALALLARPVPARPRG